VTQARPFSDIATLPTAALGEQEREALRQARQRLEHPSFAARLSSVVGTPIEVGLTLLPRPWYQRLQRGAEAAIGKALSAAITSLHTAPDQRMHDHFYKMACMASGAVGGFFGPLALIAELPISTALMLRAIADIARAQGEDLTQLEGRLACMEVFALGGRSEEDDAADTGYYGVRLTLSLAVDSATGHVAKHGLSSDAPLFLGLVGAVASRFGVAVSEQTAARLVPIIGAAGAAFLNGVFMQHFQDMAHAHFTVRALERKYGRETVEAEYRRLSDVGQENLRSTRGRGPTPRRRGERGHGTADRPLVVT
jgi:hypothetical protein